ncbi:MAG: transcription termination factor Rho [Acidimicrobiales bacterium]
MSVDSTALERSALERKDRDELLTIAQALGGKPAARAKKATIVDLILQLTGVSGPDAPGDAPREDTPTADAADAPAKPRGGRASRGPATDDAAGDSPTAHEQPVEEPPAEWELDAAEDSESDAPGEEADSSGPRAGGGGERGQQGRAGIRAGNQQADQDQSGRGGPVAQGSREGHNGEQPDRGEPGDRPNRADQGDKPGPRNGADPLDRGAQRSQSEPGDQANQRSQTDPGNRADQTDRQGGQGDDDGEGGNRRRRRRGRNRDRAGEGVVPGMGPDEFNGDPVDVDGHLDLRDEGYGFLRIHGFLPSRDDVYISVKQARQFGLRKGDHLKGASRPALRNEKNPALLRIDAVNGADPEQARDRRRFEDLTPLFPDEKLIMEQTGDPANVTARIVDLISPIGKGQRGLIVSPPKAGKTTIMKQIARSIETNNPEVHLFVLLVDERPEEVTDMKRWLKNDSSTVVASTFDRPAEEHTAVAELTIERAKRLVETGADVVVILDGITRLSRAYNLAAPPTGRVMSGGIATGALYPPKKFFGAARNLEEGGSLTILATALVETGSRMDEVIFEEFKGTGNMELRLDRRLAERRIYPAIDVDASSTRHEELLFQGLQLQNVWKLRRVLSAVSHEGSGASGLELLIDRMKSFKSNKDFLAEIGKVPGG